METIKLIYQDNRSEEDSCAVYYFQKYIYCLILKDGRITSIIWTRKEKKTLLPLFMDGVQLAQG